MRSNQVVAKSLAVLFALMPATPVSADPCGMVPPIRLAQGQKIERIGVQKTYVFYKNGIETFVIRPGYRGSVEEFGMLIPFPTPPAIRKVEDDVFPQLANAVDPPEVLVDLRPMPTDCAVMEMAGAENKLAVRSRSDVRVLRQEAVGMYEVAVLEAGSAAALQRWMTAHGYRYPEGMDATCEDYVAQKWCFVAVKTRVADKAGVDARPGMREVQAGLPPGASFDGHVQAMGFRFRSDQLVVPMRLSAFNAGDTRNVVYLLADRPLKVRSMPESFVVRQVPGWQLQRNLTEPLPLRIVGGTIADIPEWQRKALAAQQDPKRVNGIARSLFAADLLAARRGVLAHEFEEAEKSLLRIGEELGLRGPAIDALIAKQLAGQREQVAAAAFADLASMTLTVIDGAFDRELIARQNVTFEDFAIPERRNDNSVYDAKAFGPAPKRASMVPFDGDAIRLLWAAAAFLVVVGGAWLLRSRRALGAVLGLAACVALCGQAVAQSQPSTNGDIDALADPARAPAASARLVLRGAVVVPALLGEAFEGGSLHARGWAIVSLGRIGGADVDARLAALHTSDREPDLVRRWAAAARVQLARDIDALAQLAGLIPEFPSLLRPVGQRLAATLAGAPRWVERAIALGQQVPQLYPVVQPMIAGAGLDPLLQAMLGASDADVRCQAAGYVGGLAQDDGADVVRGVVDALRFDVEAGAVPWAGGALFLPALGWQRDDGRALAGALVRWMVWCDRNGRGQERQQIHNNLRSVGLARVAGYQPAGRPEAVEWLRAWAAAAGRWEVERILAEQGVAQDAQYRAALR